MLISLGLFKFNSTCDYVGRTNIVVLVAFLAKHTLGSFLDDFGSMFDFFVCQLNVKCHPDAVKHK